MKLGVTGHRPKSICGAYDPDHPLCKWVKDTLHKIVKEAVEQGYTEFHSGGALGSDTWFAEAVLAGRYSKSAVFPALRRDTVPGRTSPTLNESGSPTISTRTVPLVNPADPSKGNETYSRGNVAYTITPMVLPPWGD